MSDVSFGFSVATPADIVTFMPGENALQSRSAIIARSRSSARTALVGVHVGQHQQEFLAAIAAEPVDAADVGEHGDRECPQHLVAGRMAVGVVDALEPVEVDQRDGAGRSAAAGAGDLLLQHPHDAAAVGRPRQFVEFGKFLDPLVGCLEFEAAVVEHLAHRAAIQSHEGALADREDKGKHRGDALGRGGDRQADRRAGEQEDRRQADHGERPGDDGLPRGHPQRAESENQEHDAEEGKADFGRRQQKTKLKRDVAANLEDREIVILEPVVEMGFRQHDKDRDQSDAGPGNRPTE